MVLKDSEIFVNEVPRLLSDIGSLYLSRKFSDIQISVEDETYPAHAAILAVRSSYFEDLLIDLSLTEIVENCPKKFFKIILKYIYTGNLIFIDTSIEVYTTVAVYANKYKLLELEDSFTTNIKKRLTPQNAKTVWSLAMNGNATKLADEVEKFMALHNIEPPPQLDSRIAVE